MNLNHPVLRLVLWFACFAILYNVIELAFRHVGMHSRGMGWLAWGLAIVVAYAATSGILRAIAYAHSRR